MIRLGDVQGCLDLIAKPGNESINEDRTPVITVAPQKILEISTMELWAQSDTGSKKIDLDLPSLKDWLIKHAMNGPGNFAAYEGVIYEFVKQRPTSWMTRSSAV